MPSLEFKRPSVESIRQKLPVNVMSVSRRRSKEKRPEKTKKTSRKPWRSAASAAKPPKSILVESKASSSGKKSRTKDPKPSHCHADVCFWVASRTPQEALPALAGPSNRCANVERKLQWGFILEQDLPLTWEIYHEQLRALDNVYQDRDARMKALIQNVGGATTGEGRLDAGLSNLLGYLSNKIEKIHELIAQFPDEVSQPESLARGRGLLFDLEKCTEWLDHLEGRLHDLAHDDESLEELKKTSGGLERMVRPHTMCLARTVGLRIVTIDIEMRKLKAQSRPSRKRKTAAYRGRLLWSSLYRHQRPAHQVVDAVELESKSSSSKLT